jgi:Prokaryotic E2 family E/Multiubiquitin
MTNFYIRKQYFPHEGEVAGAVTFSEPQNQKKENKIIVDNKIITFYEKIVSEKQILEKACKVPVECFSLYQKLKGCDFEKISLDELVNISNPEIEHFITKEPDIFNYTVDGEPETTDKKFLTPTEILKLDAINPNDAYLVQINHDGTETEYAYLPDEKIKMVCTGMKFVSRKWLEIVDIEEHGKTCKPVPPARKYKVRIDKSYFELFTPFTTGKKLLVIANKQPIEKFDIYKVVSTNPQPQKINDLDAEINLREKCLVRFVTLPKEQQEGRGNRIGFSLPADDVEFLDNNSLLWEAIVQQSHWLLIKDHPVPEGYNVSTVDIVLLIPPSYPAGEIDMAYFYPPLQKKSGRTIGAISYQIIDGKNFQRWSRHRKPGEWRPGLDDISTHLLLVNNWLVNDLKK